MHPQFNTYLDNSLMYGIPEYMCYMYHMYVLYTLRTCLSLNSSENPFRAISPYVSRPDLNTITICTVPTLVTHMLL